MLMRIRLRDSGDTLVLDRFYKQKFAESLKNFLMSASPEMESFIRSFWTSRKPTLIVASDILPSPTAQFTVVNGSVAIDGDAEFFIASPFDDLLSSVRDVPTFFFNGTEFEVKSVKEIPVKPRKGWFTTLSPVYLYVRVPVSQNKNFYISISPRDERTPYLYFIRKNIASKLATLGVKKYVETDFVFEHLRKAVFYRVINGEHKPLVGYYYDVVILEDDPSVLKTIIEAGLGYGNPLGLGMVVPKGTVEVPERYFDAFSYKVV